MAYWAHPVAIQPSEKPQSPSVVARLKNNMEKKGYNQKFPVKVYKHPNGTKVCVDGNHRLAAAGEIGFMGIQVYVTEISFEAAKRIQRHWKNPDDALVINDVTSYL
jgi:FKBP-type peptidyl-prolyl cis-trans isomerase 2